METLTRVCLIGPESTGKSEMARRLSTHFKAPWVPEFSRQYAELRENRLTIDDVEPIAFGQIAAMVAGRESQASGLLILDTDLISTVVYARHYYGQVPDWVVGEARSRRADLYLMMDIDVPWIADVARDAPAEARQDLFDSFRMALDEFGCRWVIISGDWEQRFLSAIAEITR
jgi:NadR type nicotinamide-nucleotide adenylyltransferase